MLTNPFNAFVNMTSSKGLKSRAYKRYLLVLLKLKEEFKSNSGILFKEFFLNIEILIYIYRKKVGGSIYQIPIYLKGRRRLHRGLLNFFKIISNRKERHYNEKIIIEMFDVLRKKGGVINYRTNLYLLASENKANLRYALPKYKKPLVEKYDTFYENLDDYDYENEATADSGSNINRKRDKPFSS